MSLILRQSTSVVVSFGPVLDKGDGVTLETGLVSAIDHATTGIFLSKNGGALAIRSQAVTASTYDAYGNYRVTLSTTDTNTVGTLRMQFSEAATCLPVWQDFIVIEEAVYDALFAASAPGYLQPTTAGRTLDVTAANKVNGVVLVDTLTTYTGNTLQTGDSFARIGANGVGLSAIPDLAGVTTLLSRLSALRAGYLDNLSAGAAALESSLQTLITTVGAAGAGLTAAASAAITSILNRLSPIVTKTGTVNDAGASATVFITDLTESTNDYWKDAYIRLTSGALINQVKKISAYNGTTKAITVIGGFTAAPANAVTFEIVND